MTLYNILKNTGLMKDNKANYEEVDAHVIQTLLTDIAEDNKLVKLALDKKQSIRHAYTELFLRTLGFSIDDVSSVSVRDDFPTFTNMDLNELEDDLTQLTKFTALDNLSFIDRYSLRNAFKPLVYANGTYLKFKPENTIKSKAGALIYNHNADKINSSLRIYRAEESDANGLDNIIHRLRFLRL